MNDCGTCYHWYPRDDDYNIWICNHKLSSRFNEICYESEPACGEWEDWNVVVRNILEGLNES